jgi:hypothetical protein
MRDDDEFPFIKDLPRRRVTLPVAERAALVRLGLLEADVAALERVLPYLPEVEETRAEARRAFVEAMLHFRGHGAKILEGLGLCFDEILGRDFQPTIGADSIFGKARCDVKGFEINNDLRPFYVRILAARRPAAEAERISFNTSWADLLIVARWPPITTGKGDADALATPTGSPSPTPRPMATTSNSTGGDQ